MRARATLRVMLALLFVLACGDLCAPQAQGWYDQLLADGGYGRLPNERAAFLIRESDGTLTLEPWRVRGFRHASFRGALPDRAIAVIHTHPRGESRPSVHDREEAQRLGMPIIVVTPEAVTAAMADGSESVIRTSAARVRP